MILPATLSNYWLYNRHSYLLKSTALKNVVIKGALNERVEVNSGPWPYLAFRVIFIIFNYVPAAVAYYFLFWTVGLEVY